MVEDIGGFRRALEKTLRSIAGTFDHAQQQALGQDRHAKLAPAAEQPRHGADFQLVTWLVLKASPRKETPAVQEALGDALAGFANQPLRDAAAAVLDVLGYESNRTMNAGSVAEFLARYEAEDKLTERQRHLFESWQDVELVFQITDDEIGNARGLLADGFDIERISPFVFLAVELAGTAYSRTALADMTRAVNRLFAMPVVLVFRCQRRLSLAVIHRRDDNRDVLERVTLVKDVDAASPHRAHLDILADLALPEMVDKQRKPARRVHPGDAQHRTQGHRLVLHAACGGFSTWRR